jgi:16S rRNA (guanine(966)-N(2))-methyltransferase RsmD
VIAGQFKGRVLKAPPQIRATGSKVRQALFNILGDFIAEARVADVFAGSGAYGIEALSRGAAYVAFIEQDTESVLCLRDNLALLEAECPREQWRLLHLDARRGLEELAHSEPPFDVVICDPPYRTDEGKKALQALGGCAILADTGLVVIEHEQRSMFPASIGHLRQCKQHRYGDTVLSFYQR